MQTTVQSMFSLLLPSPSLPPPTWPAGGVHGASLLFSSSPLQTLAPLHPATAPNLALFPEEVVYVCVCVCVWGREGGEGGKGGGAARYV